MQKKILTYLQLPPGSEPPALDHLAPFLAIVLSEEASDELWQADIARWLVASGCRYLLAWGKDCAAWQEMVDDANLEAFDYEDVPEADVVMTTRHEDEEREEVFWFAKHRAAHPSHSFKATVILDISSAGRKDEIEQEYADA
ncbi:hypothetical protein ACI48D_06135 [Massilia sp. LXY-6]|uniref:DUF7684 family protein n=1 Tax=Massilia sp. LXY-6 TaxID=3379823 RepID=UPI003EE142B8